MSIKQEQNFLDALGGSEILAKLVDHNSRLNQAKLVAATNDKDILAAIKVKRNNPEDMWSKDRTRREILNIPPELALQLERRIPGFFKDKKIMKKALHDDPFLQQFLTVPMSTI